MNSEWFARAADVWLAWTFSSLTGAFLLYAIAEWTLRWAKNLSPQIRCAILWIVLIKCAIPSAYVLDIPLGIGEPPRAAPVLESAPDDFLRGDIPADFPTGPISPKWVETEAPRWTPPPCDQILFVLNLSVSLGIALRLLVKTSRNTRSFARIPGDSLVGQICKNICERFRVKAPRLFCAEASGEAFAGGFWRSYITLPKNLLDQNKSQIELVLAHELAHLKRWDHRANWLQLTVSTLFWWNPIVARINHLIRCEREQCCDDFVLRTFGADPRHYSRALLDAVERQSRSRRFSVAAAFASPKKVVQQRIRRILMYNKTHKRYSLLGISIVFLFAVALGFGLQIARAKADNKQVYSNLLAELKNLQNAVAVASEKDIEIDGKIVEQLRKTLAQLKNALSDSYIIETSKESVLIQGKVKYLPKESVFVQESAYYGPPSNESSFKFKSSANDSSSLKSDGYNALVSSASAESSTTYEEAGSNNNSTASVSTTVHVISVDLPKSDHNSVADLLASICLGKKESIRPQFEEATSGKPYGNDQLFFFSDEMNGNPAFVIGSSRPDFTEFAGDVIKKYKESPQHQISQERMESLRSQWQDIKLYIGYFIGEETASQLEKELDRTQIDDLEIKILAACLAKNQAEVDHWINELIQLVKSTLKKIAPEKELPKEFSPELVQQEVFRKAFQKNRYQMRKMKNMLEVCYVNINTYPRPIEGFGLDQAGIRFPDTDKIFRLNSTELVVKPEKPLDIPLPWVKEYPIDLFNPQKQTYRYNSDGERYILVSTGPDGDFDYDVSQYKGEPFADLAAYLYDPSNGLMSSGDIIAVGP